MSSDKTKYISINNDAATIQVNGITIEDMSKFTYLGGIINSLGTADDTISAICKKSRVKLAQLRGALRQRKMRLDTRGRLLETFIKPVLLYGLETLVTRKKRCVKTRGSD